MPTHARSRTGSRWVYTVLVTGLVVAGAAPLQAQLPALARDSAAVELERGRAWHAARMLRVHTGLEPGDRILLARAEAGWRNWDGVVEVLDGASWIAEIADGSGEYLLGRAYAERDRLEDGIALLRRYEARVSRTTAGAITRSRLARMEADDGRFGEALATLHRMDADPGELTSWTTLEVARAASEEGLPEMVRDALEVADGQARRRGWSLEPRALIEAGDSLGALVAYRTSVPRLTAPSRLGWALMRIGELLHALGDPERARDAFLESLEAFSRGTSGARAAQGLLELGIDDDELAARVARILAGAGRERAALEAYDRLFELHEGEPEPSVRFARARLLPALDRHEDAIVEFRELVGVADDELELRILEMWVDVRRAQGRHGAVRTVQGWILERFPESDQAAEIHYFRGDDLQDRQVWNDAAVHYVRAMETRSSHNLAGLAWMRLGQIRWGQGDYEGAREIYGSYLSSFPEGRRWEQAAYWSARSRIEMGDSLAAREDLERIRSESPMSYYAVLAAAELGEPFTVSPPESRDGTAPAPWLNDGLGMLDLLSDAGLDEAATWWVGELRSRAAGNHGSELALATALIDRGYTIEGIRLGHKIVSEGAGLTDELMRVLYPLPYRDVIWAEAEERGLDPYFLAGLIRQESAFDADIRSRAGAIGLMQVMPATGRQLARAERIRGFTSEALETPEINLHLGVNFWLDLERVFEGSHVPLRLSAYNAGPTRARRWRRLPESADPLRFTERIPFEETRGYVKAVSRYVALYRALYGAEPAPAADR